MPDISFADAEGNVYRVPEDQLEQYKIEEPEVEGFSFGQLDMGSLRPHAKLNLSMGAKAPSIVGSRIIVSVETVVGG